MDPSDYRFGQEPIIGVGAPDRRPCVARIRAKAAGEFGLVEEPVVPTPVPLRTEGRVTPTRPGRVVVAPFVAPPLRPDYKRKWE